MVGRVIVGLRGSDDRLTYENADAAEVDDHVVVTVAGRCVARLAVCDVDFWFVRPERSGRAARQPGPTPRPSR